MLSVIIACVTTGPDVSPIRVPRAASVELRGHIERHLAAHGCTGAEKLGERGLDDKNLAEFLLAALRLARERHPWIGRDGVVLTAPEDHAPADVWALAAALWRDDRGLTADTCMEALASVVPLENVDAPAGTRDAEPRTYPYFPYDWPAALADREALDHVQGVVTEAGWIDDPARRARVFRAVGLIYYDELRFVELGEQISVRLAAALWAGPENRGAGPAHMEAGRAFVRLLGDRARCFASREFTDDELVDPFAHGEAIGWSHRDELGDRCSGGLMLALLVTDGTLVATLDALWDTWSE